MITSKVFENGRSQAVRIPKEYRFDTDEVLINKVGEVVMIMPKSDEWASLLQAIDMFSDDFMVDGRGEDKESEREKL